MNNTTLHLQILPILCQTLCLLLVLSESEYIMKALENLSFDQQAWVQRLINTDRSFWDYEVSAVKHFSTYVICHLQGPCAPMPTPTGTKYLSSTCTNIALEKDEFGFFLVTLLTPAVCSHSSLYILFPFQAVAIDLLAWLRDKLLLRSIPN